MTPINRRAFLASAAALAATPALGQVRSSGEVDVAIIGAGAAGIAAARRVAAAGRRFALIEAGSRVGGRCVTDTRSFGVPFDTGAHWLRQPADINPVVRAAAKAGLDVYPVPAGQKIRIGARHARESELEAFLSAQVRATRAIGEAARGKADIAAARALPKDLADWQSTIEFVLGPFGIAKDLGDVSAMDFAKLERDSEAFCRQGYGALLAKAAEGIPVQLSTPANTIRWDRSLEVDTPKGTISARVIIVTVSMNVLASSKIKFSPELPRRHLDAAAKLKLGTYERIALDMPGNPLGLAADELVLEQSRDANTAALLANVGRSSLCFVDIGGRFGQTVAADGPKAMADFALNWLSKLYGADIRKTVRSAQATQWINDPLVQGGWSSAAPGAQLARRVLMEPLRDRLWFAGEAVHETAWGTVHGAWESGERVADAALRKAGLLKEPEKQAPKKGESEPKRSSKRRR